VEYGDERISSRAGLPFLDAGNLLLGMSMICKIY